MLSYWDQRDGDQSDLHQGITPAAHIPPDKGSFPGMSPSQTLTAYGWVAVTENAAPSSLLRLW